MPVTIGPPTASSNSTVAPAERVDNDYSNTTATALENTYTIDTAHVQIPELDDATVFTYISQKLGIVPEDNKPFFDFLSQIINIEKLPKNEKDQIKNAITKNANLVRTQSEQVVKNGLVNFDADKDPWAGVNKTSGIPMSSELTEYIGGYSPKYHYYHNCLAHHLASAVEQGLKLFESEDCDGTFVSKINRSFSTRRLQPIKQIFEHFQAIGASTEILGTEWTVNTARSLLSALILARNEGMEGSTTKGEHYSAFGEIVGSSSKEKIELANKMGVSAFNGAIKHTPSEPLYISDKLLQADSMFRHLGDKFLDDFFINPTIENEYSAAEPKGLTDYLIQTKKVLGEVYYTDYLKITQAYEETILEGKSWDEFQAEIKRLIKDENLKIIGAEPLDDDQIRRMNQSSLQPIPNYFELLEKDPQAFFFRVTNSSITSICCHFFNSRGVPKEGSIDEAKNKLVTWLYQEGVRNKIRGLNRASENNNPLISKYASENQRILKEEGIGSYINKRLLDHMMHLYQEKDFVDSTIFNIVSDENGQTKLAFKEDFLTSIKSRDSTGPNVFTLNYINSLKEALQNGSEIEKASANYLEDIVPKEMLDFRLDDRFDIDVYNKTDGLYLYPDELFCINNKNQFTGKSSFISIFNLEAKSNPLNKDGNYYWELQPNTSKGSVIPSFKDCREKKLFPTHHGDTLSDLDAQVACLERGGLAIIPYTLIKDRDIDEATFKVRQAYTESIKKNDPSAIEELKYGCTYGTYGIENSDTPGKYKKVIVNDSNEKDYVRDSAGNICEFTKAEIIKDIQRSQLGRRIRMPNPRAKVRSHSEIIQLLTGTNITLDENSDFAKNAVKQDGYISADIPKSRAWFIYKDENGEVYYRRKEDGNLISLKDEKLFTGDINALLKRRKDFAHGIDIGEKLGTKIPGTEKIITIDFLNSVLEEEKNLPAVSPKSGIFASKFWLSVFGLGNTVKGKERLEIFLLKLPNSFPKMLEWSGGLMALGGIIRLISIPLFGEESIVNKTGYWLSNGVRAFSSICGGLRGELNVNKYHDNMAGELINTFSALLLPNGLKHAGFGLGSLKILTARGRQRAQLMQRVNSHTLDDIKNNKISAIDPRKYAREITKYSIEGIILPLKKAASENGVPMFISEVGATLFSSIFTNLKMLADVFRHPKLIFSLNTRESEKSGQSYTSIPSVAHLFGVTAAISGITAFFAGIAGRVERLGEVAEHGFNVWGDWALKISAAIQSVSIFANGWEVANNAEGLDPVLRGLDGNDLKFNAKRAGYGQMFAGILFGILPWFGLHRNAVASGYDIANGIYFGLPGMKMSVAQEEGKNVYNLVNNELIRGQEFYKDRKIELADIASKKFGLPTDPNASSMDSSSALATPA